MREPFHFVYAFCSKRSNRLITARILFGVTFGAVSAIQPGPLTAFLFARTSVAGWRATWPACFAPLLSDLGVAILTLGVLGRLPSPVLLWLRVAGGLFLLWLSFGAFRRIHTPAATPLPAAKKNLSDAVILNLLNPNPYLAWLLVVGPTVLEAWNIHPFQAVSFLLSFYGTMGVLLFLLIRLFGAVESFPPGSRRMIAILSSLLLGLWGAALMTDALRTLFFAPRG